MNRYLSLQAFQTALQAIDPTVEVFSVYSEEEAGLLLETPPVGKQIARADCGMNNILLIFNATGPVALAGVILMADIRGGHFAIQPGSFTPPTLGSPVTVRVQESPQALEDYLKTFEPDNTVVVYPDEASVNPAGAYRIICQPGRYLAIKGTQPAEMLFIRDYQGHTLTVFK